MTRNAAPLFFLRVAIQRSRQKGMTLVELMIAIGLGIFLTWGALQAFLSGKQAYSLQQGLSRIQENGRLAQELIGYDIRVSGDYGCGSGDAFITLMGDPADVANCALIPTGSTPGINMLNSAGDIRYNYNFAVFGYNNVAVDPCNCLNPDPTPGTDVLVVRPTADIGSLTTIAGPGAIANLAVAPTTGLVANDVVAVSDCAHTRIYQVSAVAPTTLTLGGAAPGNRCTNEGAQSFEVGSSVKKLDTIFYYVGTNAVTNRPALYRYNVNSNVTEELLEGVESLQLQFGIDSDGDGMVNMYRSTDLVPASAWDAWDAWNDPVDPADVPDTQLVRAVRYSLLVRAEDAVLDEPQQYQFDGNAFFGGAANLAGADRRLRQVFTSTVGVRARVNPG